MKLSCLACAAFLLLAGCADKNGAQPAPVNAPAPFASDRGPGAVGSPPLQQGSVPTR